MTRTTPELVRDRQPDNQRFVDMPPLHRQSWECDEGFMLSNRDHHPHSLALSPTDFSWWKSKQNRGTKSGIVLQRESDMILCDTYVIYIIYISIKYIYQLAFQKQALQAFFSMKNTSTVAASLKKPWKARVRSSSVQCLLKVGCVVAVLCFVRSQTDVASKTTNLMVYLPMTLYGGSKNLKMHPYIQRALKANLFFKFTNKNVLLAAFWYSKLRFVWHGCVNGAGHQCNLAESTWSCFVNPARDFDGQTLGSKRCLLHEWIWLKFADDKRIDENFGQWEFWWIGNDSVDGRNPAPPGMYKPL